MEVAFSPFKFPPLPSQPSTSLHNSPSGGPQEFLFHCSQHLLGPGRGSLRCSSLLQSSIQKEARVASLPSKGGTSSAASAIWLARHARELSHES